ncbi:hypothetical protein TNIN_34211 [Trichonephila inaurata madagascariensis]|uniref:Uncharacterized protein n=1 Tax=Trichonephila inaurata madagascariensis TaxID=2747483 RepID=A0A8X6XUD3_9ARAC|nr:hypothetical protein TNIN_34211 [Trichonephila inaurata madagascariensis]
MEENKHLKVEMGPETSNVRGVSQEVCLQNQNTGFYDSVTQNGTQVEVDMQEKYSCLMRCFLLKSLDDCEVYSRLPFIHELENVEFYEIYEMINLLAMGVFYKQFNKILERRNEINANIDMDHAQFLLSRCVLLCREPTYPTFVLVVAFLSNVLILDVDDLECFKVAYITEFCLSVLYRRIFWKIFRSREDYRRLQFFCIKFNKKFGLHSAFTKLPKASVYVNWKKLIQDCIEDPNIEFPLEESEIEMFRNARRELDNMECKPKMSLKIENTYFSDSGLRKMHSLCAFCGTKCHNYLAYVSSFKSKELKNLNVMFQFGKAHRSNCLRI